MIGIGFGVFNSPVRATVTSIPANFQSVNANGWSVTYASPPTFNPSGSPEWFTVSRQGYNSSAQAVIVSEDLLCTQRIRQAYPNHASLTTDQVAISEYIYSTDSIVGGATNNSTETSPKPICNWALPDREIVGDTLTAEVVAFHKDARNGEQVAAVEFSVTDGTTTVTQIVSSSVVSGRAGDKGAVIVYRASIDISTLLNPSTLTLNAKVYPHIGGAASVADSSLNSGTRGFIPRTYRRSTSLAASPYYVYVNASTGNNTTGAVSTNAATAEAAPCLTIAGAILRAVAVAGDTAGVIIRCMAGSHALANTGITVTQAQTGGELIVTRDPNAARSAVTVTLPLISWRPRLGASGGQIRFKDISFTRSAAGDFTGEAASYLKVVVENVAFNNGSFSAAIYGTNAGGVWLDTTITNGASSFWAAGLRDHISWRGCDAAVLGPEGFLVLGCNFTGLTGFSYGTKDPSGSIIAFNKLQGVMLYSMSGSGRSQIAVVQNVIEVISTSAVQLIQFVGTGTLKHVLLLHNTCTGFYTVARNNLFYDEAATPCTTSLVSCRGNIHNQINTKGDRFDLNGALIGNWAYLYGVGCQGEFSMFIDAQQGGIGGTFAQAYPGRNASIGTSSTVRNDPLFVSYQAVTSGPTAGAGGGNYALQGGSPCKARVIPVMKWDILGVLRSTTLASAGAHE